MPLNKQQIKLLTRLDMQKGIRCKVDTLVNAFKAAGVDVTQSGCNYTFLYGDKPPLTVVFGNKHTSGMSKISKELSNLSYKVLIDNDEHYGIRRV